MPITGILSEQPERRFSVAPMMDWTDRHCRYFMRLFTRRALLYSEMITAEALTHGDSERLLAFDDSEQPVALQLGGSNPELLASAARLGEQAGYAEINLNVGCPSDRVQSGRFGACLMAEPELVAHCVQAMRTAVSIPVTVKTRIGIDEHDSMEFLRRFVSLVADGGCRSFTIHARKAWLSGLSPKQNREVPPLDYARVYRLKQEFPQLEIIVNGGIADLAAVRTHLCEVDGVMMGRAAYNNPYLLAAVDRELFGDSSAPLTREDVVHAMFPYLEKHLAEGVRLASMTRHMLGLFQGQAGARHWRRYLSEHAHLPGAGIEVVEAALAARARAA